MQLSGMSLVITAFDPIVTLLPIVIGPRIFAPGAIWQLSPIMGVRRPLSHNREKPQSSAWNARTLRADWHN